MTNLVKKIVVGICFSVGITFAGAVSVNAADKPQPISPVTVYQTVLPSSGHLLNNRDYGARSPRVIQLEHQSNPNDNGKLLLTFEQIPANGQTPVFPIYESDDNGATWNWKSNVTETKYQGWGMANCPQLYELPQQVGDMPKGTILIAGDATPNDLSNTELQMYTSTNVGSTWNYKSTIAVGGNNPTNEINDDPIWEPFFMVNNGKLICFYSDERDNTVPGSQTIVHQTTNDGVSWNPVVVDADFAKDGGDKRPGMPIVAKMSNGKYAMTYEQNGGGSAAVKISDNPEVWNSKDVGTKITNGGSPYIVTLNDGQLAFNNYSNNGRVTVFNGQDDLLKGIGAGKSFDTKTGQAYNRQLLPLSNGMLLIANGGGFGKANSIRVETIDVGDKAVTPQPTPTPNPTPTPVPDNNGGSVTPVQPTTPTQSSPSTTAPATPSKPNTSVKPITSVSTTSNKYYTSSNLKKGNTIAVTNKKGLYVYKNGVFTKDNRINYLRKGTVLKVVKVVKRDNITRIQLNDGKYITGLKAATKSVKISKTFYDHATNKAVVKKGLYEYNKPTFSNAKRMKYLKKGTIVKIKAVVKSGQTTRLQLTNGTFITAQKRRCQNSIKLCNNTL
ncbi:DUF5776 domain-containing protein [Lentilactobacillus kisonensis]|uniref:BNR/Asp-box repeat protein n=1 Tax=Lentilactobacillus kisonensis F0435 TaxID=797516 RepID=H1LIE4_9LACO|nr:DUF5776 domain-containing protein [Lentilactobacillus kisonensis]EHO49781.1 BNR/Asp-box repeat protein [Lentilactobacillus kisonensis F0435]